MIDLKTFRNLRRLMIFAIGIAVLGILPLISSAQPTTSVVISNSSSMEIRHVYLSPLSVDNWSDDQLNNSVIGTGQSVTLSNISCSQQQVKVVAEDQDGCFVSTVVTCGDSATWTITNDTARDCGGN
jgi:hypothetical protein